MKEITSWRNAFDQKKIIINVAIIFKFVCSALVCCQTIPWKKQFCDWANELECKKIIDNSGYDYSTVVFLITHICTSRVHLNLDILGDAYPDPTVIDQWTYWNRPSIFTWIQNDSSIFRRNCTPISGSLAIL